MNGHQGQHNQHVQRAQHEQHSQHEQREQHDRGRNHERDNRGRRDPRSFDSSTHHRIGREDRRYHNDRDEIRFEGYWFACDFWPGWVFESDIFFVEGPNGVFFVYQYENPAYILQVRLVE